MLPIWEVIKYIFPFHPKGKFLFQMRMARWIDGTSVPGHLPRSLAWESQLASCDSINMQINMPASEALMLHHRYSARLDLLRWFIMDFASRYPKHSRPAGCSVDLLYSVCPEACVEASARTQTGQRCSLLGCFETMSGSHFSHSAYCSTIANL